MQASLFKTPVWGMSVCTSPHWQKEQSQSHLTKTIKSWSRKKRKQGVSPAAGRTCDNDKQAISDKVSVLQFVIYRNVYVEEFGKLSSSKEGRIYNKKGLKSAIKNTFWVTFMRNFFIRKTWEFICWVCGHIILAGLTANHKATESPPVKYSGMS